MFSFKLISQDIASTKALEESLKPYGVFETEEELQHRFLANFQLYNSFLHVHVLQSICS